MVASLNPTAAVSSASVTAAQQPLPADLAISIAEAPEPARLEAVWRDLEGRADNSFYLSWHWIGPWLHHIGRRPQLLRATSGGEVVALALFCEHTEVRHKFLKSRLLCLQETGDPACDILTIEFNGILHDRRYGEALAAHCLRHVASANPAGRAWDELYLGGVPDSFLPTAEKAGLAIHVRDQRPSAAVQLGAIRASGKSYLDHLSSNTRYQLRRSLKLYKERGPLTLTAAKDEAQAREFMAGLAVLHQATWQARGKPGAFGADFLPRFHETVISRSLPSDNVEIVRISAGDQAIGYLYNFIYRGWVGAYLSGLAYESDSKLKPGLVSHYMCAEHHLAAGREVYDFMAGDNRYKTSLGVPGPDMLWLSLRRPRLKLRLEDGLRAAKNQIDERRQARSKPAADQQEKAEEAGES